MRMIDQMDHKIILELFKDGRSTNSALSKKLGISVAIVSKRIKKMIKENIISIKAWPNPQKMGYQAGAFICLNVDLKRIDNICAQLAANPHINLVVNSFGRFDVLLIVRFLKWEMLQSFIKEELPQIEGIKNIETYLLLDAGGRPQSIDLDTVKPMPLDEIDNTVIEELIRHGRPNYNNLADKLGVNKSTVYRRINLLIKEEVIRISAIPNPSKLGYLAHGFVVLNTEITKVNTVCLQLASYPEVHLIMRLMNGFDILFSTVATSSEVLYEFITSKVTTMDGVLKTETFIRGNFLHFSSGAMFLPSTEHFKQPI